MNGVIMQFFHWYHPGNLWNEFSEKAQLLKDLGFTTVWLPPAVKCDLGKEGRGYDVYDLFDLGEFDQKGTVATRYGTKNEYINAIKKAHEAGLQVYADIVLNHRMGADEKETVVVHQVNEENRKEKISATFEADAKIRFTFPGRQGKYSEFIWDKQCFSGINVIEKNNQESKGIFKIHNDYGLDWNPSASHQFGNYDYLMGADVEFRNPHVVQELKNWIRWFVKTTNVDGLRLDALKHISSDFLKDWIGYIKSEIKEDFFLVGEFWKDKVDEISEFSEKMDHCLSLFDVPLHYNFFSASKEKENYDLTRIFDDTMFQQSPERAVSFVGNHDTQRLQALESSVEDWFRPIAYSIILMSEKAYPCIFYPDLFGAEYTDKDQNGDPAKIVMRKVEILPKLLEARQKYAFGDQENYFDHPNCISWVRKGSGKDNGCVVIISNNGEAFKHIDLGKENADFVYVDFLNNRKDSIRLDKNGKAKFWVDPKSVSIWVRAND